jgi:hypothetical protein
MAGSSSPRPDDNDCLRLPATSAPCIRGAEKKESTGLRLSQPCPPYVTPSSISSFGRRLNGVHTAGNKSMKNSGANTFCQSSASLRWHFFRRLRAIGGLGTAPYLAASPRGLAGLPNENLACCTADVARGQIWPPTGGCKHENERLVCATIRRSGDSVIEGHKPYKMNFGLAHYGRGDRG